MDASAPPADTATPPRASPQIRAVLVCDLADSTALVERLGDAAAAELVRRHDRLARDVLHTHGGREIDKTDGFLVLFERPLQAVAFALAYQRMLRGLSQETHETLRARIGIHVGEVVLWDNVAADVADGAKPVEVEGLAKPVAARLMGLAQPGQILLSETARSLAQRAQAELPEAERVRWLAHGRYHFKGVPLPMVVHEVGEIGLAPLLPPPSGPKARRDLPWWRRPAALAVEAALLLLAIAIPVYLSLRTQPAIAFAERDWVVLGDLRNLTAEPLFNDALDEAFRIGLEQSRYVNVIPELQLRDGLRRMQRQPGESVDRDTAIELALREGARAVILPTVAEVGGRVRVSAEIIDPSTGVTVFGESADGKGAEAMLPAMDAVVESVRMRLGESLASIETSSQPLERVTTANLDALRAYSVGVRAIYEGDLEQALQLLTRAVELDPEFATAYAKIAQTYFGVGRIEAAKRMADRALALKDRLPQREQLYIEAARMAGQPVDDVIQKWTLLADLYPDFAAGPHNVAMFQWQMANRYSEAEAAFERAVATKSPLLFASHAYRGYALLGLGQLEQAEASFRTGLGLSPNPIAFGLADALSAQQRYEEAEASLKDEPAGLSPFFAVHRHQRRIANLVAQGRHHDALAALGEARALADGKRLTAAQRRLRLIELQLLEFAGRSDDLERVLGLTASEFQEHGEAEPDYDPWLMRAMLACLAARTGHAAVAQRLLAASHPPEGAPYDFFRERFITVAEAQLQLTQGDAAAAVARLQPLLDGREPFEARAVLHRAYLALDDHARAEGERRWMAQHRGRAYAEFSSQWAMQPSNIESHRLASIAPVASPD